MTMYNGRFMSVDPLKHLYPDHTPYHYVLNNPVNYLDPSGEYVVSKDGRYVTRVPQGALQAVSGLQNVPIAGTFATLNKVGMSGDPSVSLNAGDVLNLVTAGTFGTVRGIYNSARNMTRAERMTLNTLEGASYAGSTALGAAFSDDANLFMDSQIFNVATSLGFGQANIANRGFFKVSDSAIAAAQAEGTPLNEFIGEQFENIEGTLKEMAQEGGYNLNHVHGQIRFRNMLKNMSEEERKERFGY